MTDAESKAPSVGAQQVASGNQDDAWRYLQDHAAVQQADVESVDLQQLRRKIDWNIVPLMFCCYTLQFIDKVIINYAAVMGISAELNLVGNDFSNVGTSFFIAYLIAEVPNTFLLQKVPAGKWLGANVILWGIVVAATAGVKNYTTLVVARVFLGLFEATIGPSLMLISSQYYTKSEQAPRFSIWYLGLGVGQILGGLISFAFQHVSLHASLSGWRIMFIVLGLITSLIGCLTFFFIPDTPMKARFLSEVEKVALLKHISSNKTGIWNTKFEIKQIIEALLDPQLWLLTLMVILQSVSSGVVTTYSSTLIRNLGFSPQHSALLNMPSGIVSIFFTLLVGFGIRRASHRWAWVFMCSIPGIIGGGLMSFLPKWDTAGLLIGVYLVNAIVAPLPIIYHWTAANCAGYTKRAFASALVAGSFSVGNIIGPQTFQVKDAPDYRPAKIAVLATQAAAGVLAIVLFIYYVWENKRRDAQTNVQAEIDPPSDESSVKAVDWSGLTDKENSSFRYVY
ncbi:putative MFS transporter [Talaromyces proteolyticus]|uniref:MFS transporter n=1 Tax=Talaromyces proteolyticus TaxID=1131652 RepID=A0AAD4KD65_9EURO|nr:putative MFS transporter [Talaromyces proteolyticus]KAH8688836.1 putative MFS transporter [Talaromyces proteolyticus]